MVGTPARFPSYLELDCRWSNDEPWHPEKTSGEAEEGLSVIEGWNPESSRDDGYYVSGDFAEELAIHLPEKWTVTEFRAAEPSDVNHAGCAEIVDVEHEEGVLLRLRPAETSGFSHSHGPTVKNSHVLKRKIPGKAWETVAGPDELSARDTPATVLAPLVEAANRFSRRYRLFH